MRILAIDPGSRESGWVLWSPDQGLIDFDKAPNSSVKNKLALYADCIVPDKAKVVIEKITLYQRADENIHDTVLWCGRFLEVSDEIANPGVLMTRTEVKKTLLPGLKTTERNDSTIKAYLKDRFAPGVSNHGKGTKKEPGYFYGFKADVWQAFALAVAYHDKQQEGFLAA